MPCTAARRPPPAGLALAVLQRVPGGAGQRGQRAALRRAVAGAGGGWLGMTGDDWDDWDGRYELMIKDHGGFNMQNISKYGLWFENA